MNIFSTSLRARLLISYLGLLLLGLGGLTLFAGRQIETRIYTDFVTAQKVQAYFAAATISTQIGDELEYVISDGILEQVQQSTPSTDGAQVALLSPNGAILADSAAPAIGVSCANGPEFSRSVNGTTSEVVTPAELQAAKNSAEIYSVVRLQGEDDHAAFVCLRSATDRPHAETRQQWTILGTVFAVVALLGTLLSLWLLSTLTRPLSALRNTALRMADGELDQRVAVSAPDEIGQVGNAFNEMATQVEAMVAEQRAFAANASHELRTPLTTIQLRTEALRSGTLGEEKSQTYISEIEHEVQRMGGLVSDLILLSRLDAKQLSMGHEEVQVDRVLRAVARDLESQAASKEITIAIEPPPQPLPTATATMNHLQVVLRNLLNNAIKYTPEGGAVSATTSLVGEQIVVTVRDNGVGIAAKDLPRVTERFYRADKAHSRETDGVGLGLPLVKSIVELYGGNLRIQSTGVGQGTTVIASLPVTQQI